MFASPSQSPRTQDTFMSALWKFISYLHPSLCKSPRADPAQPVIKSGPLSVTSGGLCWKFWKKRWFILTRTSLVFYESDPQGDEVSQTLGGIDLNNSGSVFVTEDQNLLTVLFPDGHDGREFTLKAESSKELHDWKKALEKALAQSPDTALVTGQSGTSQNEIDGRLKSHVKSLVVGMPIFHALEDIDGETSFLEKALIFLEMFGTKVEGILRQSADVEEVGQRVQEYEQGRNEFNSDEDAHVVGDGMKLVLRKLPSSPVPASCCTALLEAQRIEGKEARIIAMRSAILKTLPEPNKRLLRRILKMMHTIAAHASENQMNSSAVAACMAPLLLCPLLAGTCELDGGFDLNADDSVQLLAAANAATDAQAILTTLVEEYENIFGESSSGAESKNPKGQVLPSAIGSRHFTREQFEGSVRPSDPESTRALASPSELYGVDSGSIPSTPRRAVVLKEKNALPSVGEVLKRVTAAVNEFVGVLEPDPPVFEIPQLSSSGADSKNPKGQVSPSAIGSRHFTRELLEGSASPSDSESTRASASLSELCGVDSGSTPSPPRRAEESSSGADLKNPKGQVLPSAIGSKHFTRELFEGSASPSDS